MTPCRGIAELYVYTETTYVALSQQYVFMFDVIKYWYCTLVKYQSFINAATDSICVSCFHYNSEKYSSAICIFSWPHNVFCKGNTFKYN